MMTYNHVSSEPENQGRPPQQEDDSVTIMTLCIAIALIVIIAYWVNN